MAGQGQGSNSSGSRRRVLTFIKGDGGVSAVGNYSQANADMKWCDRHYISLVRIGVASSGVISIRGLPVMEPKPNTTSAAISTTPARASPIGVELVDLSKAISLCWEVSGFFSAFELAISTVIGGGGNVLVVVNSVDTVG